MQIAMLLYEGLTALDLIGPYEVLCRLPGAETSFVAKKAGEIRVDTGIFGLVADKALTDVPRPDIFLVPGGSAGTMAAAQDAEILDWVRTAHEASTWTTSVCTGSLILGAAGVLQGKRAATHWAAREMLGQYGATYGGERVVRDGKIVTAAGVSSGIDMALTLVGLVADAETAKTIQLAVEYDPEPPYDAGSPDKAGEPIVARALEELLRGM